MSSSLPAPGASSSASTGEGQSPERLTVTLNVLSPSTTVTPGGPITFPSLPLETTIKQVKELIRQALPLKPNDDQQRLIYKGRSLQQDDETLVHLMGEETIREHDRQTIHLVLRGIPEAAQPPVPAQSSIRGRSPAADHRSFLSSSQGRAHSPHHTFGPTPSGATRRSASSQSPLTGFAVPNAPTFTPQQVQQMQTQLQQSMAAWSSGLQREAVNRAMANHQINQNQSARAAMGLHGIGDHGGMPSLNVADTARGRVSPGIPHPYTRTTVREGTLADGQPYRVTNTETWTPLTQGEVQNIIRGADAGQATQAMTNAMQRSESPAPFSPAAIGSGIGVSTPFYPTMGSRTGSRRATPDPTSRSVSGGSTNITANHVQRATPPSVPEVYILSSPQGPRALLINNNADTYYTPSGRYSGMPPNARLWAQPMAPWQVGVSPIAQSPSAHPQPTPTQPRAGTAPPEQPPAQPALQPQAPGMAPIVPGHGNNVLMAPAFAQIGQHIWLLIRLAFVVWWLTYSNPSWTRWFTVLAVAITIFIVHTGILNGFFNQAGGHVRHHMDNLLAHPRRDAPGREEVNPAPQAQGMAQAPDPAQAATRLVAQRRHANANWLSDVARRLERAGLLFLASIAPGVAERHIAQLEAEERQAQSEREQSEAAAAAAAAAAATAANPEEAARSETAEGQADHGDPGAAASVPQNANAVDEHRPEPVMAG